MLYIYIYMNKNNNYVYIYIYRNILYISTLYIYIYIKKSYIYRYIINICTHVGKPNDVMNHIKNRMYNFVSYNCMLHSPQTLHDASYYIADTEHV